MLVKTKATLCALLIAGLSSAPLHEKHITVETLESPDYINIPPSGIIISDDPPVAAITGDKDEDGSISR